jgi:hypothetical protein
MVALMILLAALQAGSSQPPVPQPFPRPNQPRPAQPAPQAPSQPAPAASDATPPTDPNTAPT